MKTLVRVVKMQAVQRAAIVAGLALVSGAAMAGGGGGAQFDTLTDAFDFDDVKEAVLVGAAALMGLYILIRGAKTLLGFGRSG